MALCHLEISCDSESSPAITWKLVTMQANSISEVFGRETPNQVQGPYTQLGSDNPSLKVSCLQNIIYGVAVNQLLLEGILTHHCLLNQLLTRT